MLRLLDGNESFAGAGTDAKESSEIKRSSMTRKRSLENAIGGSAEAFASAGAAIAKDYMESHRGPDDSGSNTEIHGAAKLCISGKTKEPSSLYNLYEKGRITITEYNKLRGRLDRLQLFPSPYGQQGPSWMKPVDYLAVILTSSGLGGEAVEQEIETICRCIVHIPTSIWALSGQLLCLFPN